MIAKRLWWIVLVALVSCSDAGLEESPSSVVLVVADLEGGGTRYGAGVVIDLSGSVVTNWHLLTNARSLQAMFYRRGRPSYTPLTLGTRSSGGPLLDAHGRIVGLNTSKLFEPAEGIGFARPAALVRQFATAQN